MYMFRVKELHLNLSYLPEKLSNVISFYACLTVICNTIQKRIVKYETGTVPKKILDANKTYFVVFHNEQKVITK